MLRYDFTGNALSPAAGPLVVVSGLPANVIGEHDRKTVVLDHSGGLLVNIGSPSNACQEMNRIPLSPGVFPCPQLDTRAGVWRGLPPGPWFRAADPGLDSTIRVAARSKTAAAEARFVRPNGADVEETP